MLGLEHGFRVVDVHVRLDPAGGPGDYRVGPERLERELRGAGVVRAVVFAGPSDSDDRDGDGYLAANNAVARHAVERPFVPFARLRGARDPDPSAGARLRSLAASRDDGHATPEDVERYAYGDRFEGFVLDPGVDGLPDEAVLDALADVALPVVVHERRGFPLDAVERHLLGRSLPVVLAPDAAGRPRHDRAARVVELLDRHDDLWVETGGLSHRAVLERAVREHPDRVLFGSGTPAVHPSVAVTAVLTLDVPRDAMRRVFDRNAARVVPSLAGEEDT